MTSATNFADLDRSSWRFEWKYRLDIQQYYRLRSALVPYVEPDPYTRRAPDGRYLVRSLYYDTYDYQLFDQKMAGDSQRVKFRLRTYDDQPRHNTAIKVELKVRTADAMKKYTASVSIDDYWHFQRHRYWPADDHPVLNEFARGVQLRALQAQVLIDYRRQGFQDRSREGIRVTFDHRVCSLTSGTLFPVGEPFFRQHHPLGVVFEVKCRHQRPAWLRRLVQAHGLRVIANSKFTQGIQSARHDLYRPDGVVVIR